MQRSGRDERSSDGRDVVLSLSKPGPLRVGPQREMNVLVHVMMRSCLYSELEIPFAHAGGNEVHKHDQVVHEDENQVLHEQAPTTYRPSQCYKNIGSTCPKT